MAEKRMDPDQDQTAAVDDEQITGVGEDELEDDEDFDDDDDDEIDGEVDEEEA